MSKEITSYILQKHVSPFSKETFESLPAYWIASSVVPSDKKIHGNQDYQINSML